MCNIAGYAGERPAAPILLEMLRREEGFDAGYYSGIATIHEGKIYYAKLTGNVQRLIDNTDAAALPGNTGIIHGRSGPISGDDRWAHPFVSKSGGEIELAYVANGGIGFAANRRAEYGRLADSLLSDGFDLPSRQTFNGDVYNKLSDGTTAHMSDVMCQLIAKNYFGGKNPQCAMADAFCEMPSEIVGLLLSLSDPDKIFFARINQPMFAGFANHGAYLATTSIAFPDDAGEAQLLPPLSSGYITQRELHSSPFKNPPCTVAPIDAKLRHDAYDAICRELRAGNRELWNPITEYNLADPIIPMFKKADCVPENALMYDILYSLYKEGMLSIDTVLDKTSVDGVLATRFKLGLK
ncbi:MAG: hypothetical protein IJP38_03210 [Oscillospiraceae bacterium]|nr:hypothetical protein [Oscillospiraceae bacterium]